MTGLTDPLRIDHVEAPGGGVIGMTFCPGKKDRYSASGHWDRDLDVDIAAIRRWGANAVVTLMEQPELAEVGVPDSGERVERAGMDWHHLPIRDVDIPDDAFARLWRYSGLRLRACLRRGGRIVLHCRGGLGRTGTIAGMLLAELGVSPGDAIKRIRAARSGTIETSEQEAYVRATRRVDEAADSRAAKLLGCLIGGAVGDAFGYAIEFDSLDTIRREHGQAGLREPVLEAGKLVVSDDTQMTLFTLEGLTRAMNGGGAWSSDQAVDEVRRSYLDWLDTQGGARPCAELAGTLALQPALRAERAPGNTCLSALQAGGTGTIESPINHSKGCGGAMRTAPVGLLPWIDSAGAFSLGARIGALTHGHPDGWGPAGFVPAVVRRALAGEALPGAIAGALADLRAATKGQRKSPSTRPYEEAQRLAAEPGGDPTAHIRQLGEGWTGEEAAAIAVYAALTGRDFRDVVAIAANHDGDSDSTASIAGQFWGAAHGLDDIPHSWVRRLDVFDELLAVAGGALDAKVMPRRWHEYVVGEHIDRGKPGIYEWRIDGVGTYIGKYKRISRPEREYGRNIARRLSNKPYRKSKPDNFRRIHVALAAAVRSGRKITLVILENVPEGDINAREQALIRERSANLNG
jgi:ADP-ribosylglycohydrolase/protein-tyrosine phosphatase